MSDQSIDQLARRVAAVLLQSDEPAPGRRTGDARADEKPRSDVTRGSGPHKPAGQVGQEPTLSEADIERIAQRTAELLTDAGGARSRIVDVATVARELKVSVDYVYEHQRELGAMRLGRGPRASLRFDLAEIMRSLRPPDQPSAPKRWRGGRKNRSGEAPLLPVKGAPQRPRS
jgi:hypothetical protein